MTDNSKLERLFKLLGEAETLVKDFTGGYSSNFFSAQEFHAALSASIIKLKEGSEDQVNDLWVWFAPAGDWDAFTHREGEALGNEIFQLLTDWKKTPQSVTITDLITDYQKTVDRVMEAFKQEFNRADLLAAWRHDRIFPQVGKLTKYHIKRYAFHGIGLAVDFDDKTSVDFDFAFLPEQRHDGFDLWRLTDFVASHADKYRKYLDKKRLKDEFDALVDRGVIVRPAEVSTLFFFKSALAGQGA